MNAARRQRTIVLWSMTLIGLAACGSGATPNPAVGAQSEPLVVPTNLSGASESASEEGALEAAEGSFSKVPDPGTAVPVTSEDPAWGNPLAPVTMVIWADFECPFCSKLMMTLELLQEQYGPEQLRVVWKHNPLPFHKNAYAAHVAAETVLRLGGVKAFWNFHAIAFRNQRSLDRASFIVWAAACGVDSRKFEIAYDQQRFAAQVDNDMALGKKVGVTGTPASFINGIFLSGAQPFAVFEKQIDAQIRQADKLRRAGVPEKRIYAQLSDENFQTPPPKAAPPPPDLTVWKVPLDGSPVRGKKTALVTMVMFSDFQCPFCNRVIPTVAALERKYGDKLRVVYKHNPLPMHPRAEPAAQFVIEAGAQQGESGFWKAHDAVYGNGIKLEEADLLDMAKTLGLDPKRVKKAMDGHKHADRIERDLNLADDLQASGTPHFFINGRRLVGAQPAEKFEAVIDEEIVKGEKLVAAGTLAENVYETLTKDGKVAPPMQRVLAPAPTRDNPAKGAPLGAPITIQMFADFQCPFCKRAQETIDQLVARYPGKVRVVWRHKPLPFHKFAQMASEASVEAFRQKGDAGFWAFSTRLFEAQSSTSGIDRAIIENVAGEVGLDVAKLSAAIDARTHWKVVQADLELAERLTISGTPGFVVNDYFVSGAQPFSSFRRIIEEALKPHKPIPPDLLLADARQPVALLATSPPPFLLPNPSGSSVPPSSLSTSQKQMFGAKHLVVMYVGSRRAPVSITRTKVEALVHAQEALKRLHAGAIFADIVAQYSDEPGAGQRGGDLGTFPQGAMVPEFQTAVENTLVGQLSGVVETPFGYHIIWRTQ